MCSGSPTAYIFWSILSVIFLIVLLTHLWIYDRFQCVKWNSGRQPGAFKRFMTYSYLGGVPLLAAFSVGMTYVKTKEGYTLSPEGVVMPKPCFKWDESNKNWLLPLYFCLSGGWALEIVTHLEELTFWLFLLNQGPSQRNWFHSWEFRMWYIGSTLALIGLPLTALLARKDIESTQAWILLVGSSASTCTTICFFYVLARFPQFIQQVKAEGAEPTVVVRLATFYQLNQIRVVFRFIFTVPLLIIAADGIQGPFPIVDNVYALDLLFMLGAIGCVISSGITLFVFFPRSIAQESGYIIQEKGPMESVTPSVPTLHYYHYHPQTPSKSEFDTMGHDNAFSLRHIHSTPVSRSRSRYSYSIETASNYLFPGNDSDSVIAYTRPPSNMSCVMTKARSMPPRNLPVNVMNDDLGGERLRPIARRHSDGANYCERYSRMTTNPTHLIQAITLADLYRPPAMLHPYLMNFTSPIDLLDDSNDSTSSRIQP